MRRALLVLAVFASSASAAPKRVNAKVEREFQAGVDAFRLGKLDDAKAHLAKARAGDPSLPGPHRFLAAVAQAQEQWQDCIDEARAALLLNPRSTEAAETRKLHDACRSHTGRAPYRGELPESAAAIAVTTNVPGATVRAGGLAYGGTPLAPRRVPAGGLDLEIEKAGWKTARVHVDAPAGIVTDVAVELESAL